MTFQIKIRGSADRPIAAEYLCPVHGRFSREVQRDENGDPPGEVGCEELLSLREAYSHPTKGLRWGTPGAPCREPAVYVISAPTVGVRRVEAVKGGWQKPERATWLDTRDLGEGQDLDDWRKKREAIRDQERRDSLKELMNG